MASLDVHSNAQRGSINWLAGALNPRLPLYANSSDRMPPALWLSASKKRKNDLSTR